MQKDALPIGLLHLPLGRPIANTQVYILDQIPEPGPDRRGGRTANGGGSGLARGYLQRPEMTIYFSIPIIFRQFIGTIAGQAQLPRLRIIQLGSDLVTHRELEDYQKHFSADTILIIRFGTTETGTLRRMFFNVEPRFEEITVPVGYATEDSHISLLDEEGKEVKCGATGEIVVESRYLSPGYWQRADLTRETFFSNPNGGDKRIYHTGDLGRLRSDGLLYHLGRKDFQLSIRGYRVEDRRDRSRIASAGQRQGGTCRNGQSIPGIRLRSLDCTSFLWKPILAYSRSLVHGLLPSTSLLRRAAREKLAGLHDSVGLCILGIAPTYDLTAR